MSRWRRPVVAVLVGLGAALPAGPARSDGAHPDPAGPRLPAGGPTADLHTRVRTAAQARRHRDPAFQQHVQALPVADALNLYAQAVEKLGGMYVDRGQAAPARLYALGLAEFDKALGDRRFRDRHLADAPPEKVAEFRKVQVPAWATRAPGTPADARQVVHDVVADAQARLGVKTPSAVVFEFLCGACGGLDEYTAYVPPGDPPADPLGELAGYGLRLRAAGPHLVVAGVAPLSWAALAAPDLRAGDRVVRVNGRPAGPGGLAAALRAAGRAGHDLEVEAADAAGSVHVPLPVPLPTVFPPEVADPVRGVGYVRLAAFREATPREFEAAVRALKAQGVKALVVDVRGNPGGLLLPAVQVAQRLIPSGVVATTAGQVGEFAGRVFSSDTGPAADQIPVVLLIDGRTMSAAEVLAAAWRDQGRAILVGAATFGKGVVQAPVRLSAADGPDGAPHRSGSLVVTVATVARPGGGPIHGAGVFPHLLEPDPDLQLKLAVKTAGDLAAGR